ncbi:MAG: hypothetical protein HKP29_09605 [Silicimonas sp.]|nr:hypothetical protein [Silicimonas sp.]
MDITRILVASYFIGLGLGLFRGPSATALFEALGFDTAARLLSGLLVVGLASLVFLDIARRASALLLASVIFLSSYIVLMSSLGSHGVVHFWRDLAVVGLIFFALRGRAEAPETPPRRSRAPTKDQPADAVVQRANPTPDDAVPAAPRHPRRVRTEIYRQDFDIIRVP